MILSVDESSLLYYNPFKLHGQCCVLQVSGQVLACSQGLWSAGLFVVWWVLGQGVQDGPWVSCYRVCVGVLVVVVGAAAPHYLVLMSFAVWPLLGSPSLFFPAGVMEVSVFLWCVWPVAWFSLLGLRCPGLTQVADTFTHITHTRSIATDLHKHSCRLTLTAVSHV